MDAILNLGQEDLDALKQRGISPEELKRQLDCFEKGFPYLKVMKAATAGDGIMVVSDAEKEKYIDAWRDYMAKHDVVKFTPASGAASRMFKALYEWQNRGGDPTTNAENQFVAGLSNFAFYDALNKACQKNEGKMITRLVTEKKYANILDNLLGDKGLNYQFLPKGLLLFHKSAKGEPRTPFEEHLVEGALYAKRGNGKVRLHYTVSEEHMPYFTALKNSKVQGYEYDFGAEYEITFSVQSHSTDTVAATADNQPFRSKGKIVFRPGGHGALIQNLNSIDSDVIFIKNIDNVVPDALKQPTVEYKALIAGVLISYQEKIFHYLTRLENDSLSEKEIDEISKFASEKLCIVAPSNVGKTKKERIDYLRQKLNRPLRVCGMVKNEGEPGGGPFFAQNQDGSISLQILESAQFDENDEEQMNILKTATHFNPVDLVCAVKDYKGKKFDLLEHVDHNTGFISSKSKDGQELKALELPGLWNGAMSDWNTIFVEVPIETFNPVKTVCDLLRPEHQI